MHFVNIATAFALVASTQAFAIPQGTSEGVYTVVTRDNGAEVHTKISDSSEANTTDATPESTVDIFKRSKDKPIFCGCGFTLDPVSTHDAATDLENQLTPAKTINANSAYYSIRGNVVAFVCNRSPTLYNIIGGTDVDNSYKDITKACGVNIAGSQALNIFVAKTQTTVVGYQRWKDGDRFCDTADSSSASTC